MFEFGRIQELKIVKIKEHGAYLSELTEEDGSEERILLPSRQVPEGAGCGDRIKVFVYRDSEDRPIATVRTPLITLGRIARLKVVGVSKPGAFLDWGLEKDLFLPYKEQTYRVKPGDEVLCALYLDKSRRLAATMNVYKYLSDEPPYKTGDDVEGTAYEKSERFGVFVAVDDMYSAIIPKQEIFNDIPLGSSIRARVTRVREDGRLNLSIREKAYLQIEPDMQKILELLDSYGGSLPFTEKADPQVIARECGMSKNEFKRAVGHLYKLRMISINEGHIRKADKDE